MRTHTSTQTVINNLLSSYPGATINQDYSNGYFAVTEAGNSFPQTHYYDDRGNYSYSSGSTLQQVADFQNSCSRQIMYKKLLNSSS
jgi:hypothetical protein